MIPNRFTLLVFGRLVLISLTMALLLLALDRPGLPFTSLFLLGLFFWQFLGLLCFLTRTNEVLAGFFSGIRSMDATRGVDLSYLQMNFGNLGDSMEKAFEQMKTLRAEKEKQALLNQCVIDRIATGILVADQDGGVVFHNAAAARLLGVEGFTRLDHLKGRNRSFREKLGTLVAGKPLVVRMDQEGRELPVSLLKKDITVGQQPMEVITMQPIRAELDQGEVASWQKLIRVLTHEMMNNMTPLVTLSRNIEKCLEKTGEVAGTKDSPVQDAVVSARMIGERSQGLMNFVNNYRSLTLLPAATCRPTPLKPFLEKMLALFTEEFQKGPVRKVLSVVPEDLQVALDEQLLSQALINLIKNALEALPGDSAPEISLKAFVENGQAVIRLADNGVGIPPENLDAVFVPFFTTKEHGSGVGLSLCKQIMSQHQGSLELRSESGKGTEVSLWF